MNIFHHVYEIADDPIPELDKCLEIVNDNYVERTESELKADIERYIPMVDKMYDIDLICFKTTTVDVAVSICT